MVESEWQEVKKKKKFVPREVQEQQASGGGGFGGKKGGKLVAGPIMQKATKYGGPGAYGSSTYQDDDDWDEVPATRKPKSQAQAIADYDYGVGEESEIKYETVSHVCASEVQAARLKADLTQAQLASKVNEKTSAIVELENGTARYSADLINRIEKTLGCHINRGRKKRRGGKK